MSRAFLKEEAFDEPVLIPPRAPLPPGVVNYVTPRGLRLLKSELEELEIERERIQSARIDSSEQTRMLTVIRGRTKDLRARIAGARVLHPRKQPKEEVRFGATISARIRDGRHMGEERSLKIVGVDEADASGGHVAFTAPIARALIGRKVGETATLHTPDGVENMEIIGISYECD